MYYKPEAVMSEEVNLQMIGVTPLEVEHAAYWAVT